MIPNEGPRIPVRPAMLAAVWLALSAPGPAAAQDPAADSLFHSTVGRPVATGAGPQYDVAPLPDGAGGAFFAWVDERGSDTDVYVQHLGQAGRPAAGWPPGGTAACLAERGQYAPRLATDGSGGVYVAWQDLRGSVPSVFVQHVLGDGRRDPAWPRDGMPACTADVPQLTPAIAADGTRGVLVAWEDRRGPTSAIYVQRIAVDATVEIGWPTNGEPVTPTSGGQFQPHLVPDDANGAFVVWEDLRGGVSGAFVQRITWRGRRADGWPTGGLQISPSIGRQDLVRAVRDAAGGAFIAWRDLRRGTPDLFLARIEGNGHAAQDWPGDGITLASYPSGKDALALQPDGTGGVFATWEDDRSGSGTSIYAQRVDGAGRRVAGWPNDGRALSSAGGYQVNPSIVPDGAGGVFGTWQDFREGTGHVYGQYLTGAGVPAPGWPSEGLRLASDAAGQVAPAATSDAAGGVVVAWEQGVADARLFAARVGARGLGAEAVTVASTDVGRDRIVVTWRAQTGASFELVVQRRKDDADWADLGAHVPGADGTIEIEDRNVVPGARYGYRLARPTANGRDYMGEVWVETAAAPVLALAGMVPNPAHGDVRVAFSVPATAPGMLELIDVAGRRMRWRDLGSLEPGRHVVDLGAGSPVPPGFYLVRLVYGHRILTARGTVIR